MAGSIWLRPDRDVRRGFPLRYVAIVVRVVLLDLGFDLDAWLPLMAAPWLRLRLRPRGILAMAARLPTLPWARLQIATVVFFAVYFALSVVQSADVSFNANGRNWSPPAISNLRFRYLWYLPLMAPTGFVVRKNHLQVSGFWVGV